MPLLLIPQSVVTTTTETTWLAGLLARRGVSVTLYRAGTAQTAQQVYIQYMTGNLQRVTAGGDVVEARTVMYGMPSLDAERGDRFAVSGEWFEVVFVRPAQGGKYRAAECRVAE